MRANVSYVNRKQREDDGEKAKRDESTDHGGRESNDPRAKGHAWPEQCQGCCDGCRKGYVEEGEAEVTKSKWTPGPWVVMDYTDDEEFPRWCVVPSSCVGTIAHVQKSEANANLIAAAPDLYEVLEAMVDGEIGNAKFNAMRHAALAKARGEKQ